MFKNNGNQKYNLLRFVGANPMNPLRAIKAHNEKAGGEHREYALYWENSNLTDEEQEFSLVDCKNDNVIFSCNYEELEMLKKMIESIEQVKDELKV